MVKLNNIIIGITGTMTSGKGALQYFLVDRGFKAIRNTQPILDEGLKQKEDMSNRQNWLDILVDLRKKQGLGVLAKKASEQIQKDERYVICPIRHPADIKLLKEDYNALIIFVDAPFETRYRRTFLKEISAGMSKEEFKKKDDFEHSPDGADKEYLPNINECKKLSDEVIINDGSLNELNEKLERILRNHKIPDLEDTDSFDDFDM
ncbi:hypothetical protein JW766_03505 [Candidatus Dojkabacteria bacterium]|nr:hypothetical protein [Candidatus Dojkabacteria bacterium]